MTKFEDVRKAKEISECKHNFFAVDKMERESATIIVCAWCGQVRQLKSNGEVAVLKHKGSIRYEV